MTVSISFNMCVDFIKFIYSEKATKFCEIVLCSNGQIYGGDFAQNCDLLRTYEL